MKKIIATICGIVALGLMILSPFFADAQIIPSIPYTLTNGSLADATQVMGNFNTIVTDTNANAATAGANTDITSLTGLTTPLANTYGGTVISTGGVTGGSANAQTLTTVIPSAFALVIGNIVTGIAGYTNTGPMTLTVAGGSPQSVVVPTPSGLLSTPANSLVSGQTFVGIYDGTYWDLIDAPPNGVTNAQLALMSANTIKANATALSSIPQNLALTSNTLLGLSSTGTGLLAPISLDSSLQTRGNVLGLASTNTYVSSILSPSSTNSSTPVMMGLAGAITPQSTGVVDIQVLGNIREPSGSGGGTPTMQLYYGTGAAPSNGVAATGTALGPLYSWDYNGIDHPATPVNAEYILTGLTTGVTYWIDAALSDSGGSTVILASALVMGKEIK